MLRACACRLCRLCVQADIEQTWERNPRWMGVFTARYLSAVGAYPWPLYREVFATMVARGILIETADDHAGFARYLLARLVPHPSANPKGETS
jgi:hypothetical protein